eukprot:scaffold27591_cov50-Attheya_sp.AAC.1
MGVSPSALAGRNAGRRDRSNGGAGRKKTVLEKEVEENRDHLPLLYALAQRWAWPAVTHRVSTHPHELDKAVCPKTGDTALHWACIGRPPLHSVQALAPKQAHLLNHKQMYPLHVACDYRASPEVLGELTRTFPDAAGTVDATGRYPIYTILTSSHVITDRLVQSVEAVLDASPDGAFLGCGCIDPRDGLSPLQYLHSTFRCDSSDLQQQQQEDWYERLHRKDPLTERQWHLATMLMKAEYKFLQKKRHANHDGMTKNKNNYYPAKRIKDDGEHDLIGLGVVRPANATFECLVHASLEIRNCPIDFIKLAIHCFPDQVHETDCYGNLPLHIAATNIKMNHPDHNNPCCRSLMRTLIDAHPMALLTENQQGLIPLAAAIQENNTNVAFFLLQSNPAAVETLNLDVRLYPTLLAHISCPNERRDQNDANMGSKAKTSYMTRRRKEVLEKQEPLPNSMSATIGGESDKLTMIFELLQAKPTLVVSY